MSVEAAKKNGAIGLFEDKYAAVGGKVGSGVCRSAIKPGLTASLIWWR